MPRTLPPKNTLVNLGTLTVYNKPKTKDIFDIEKTDDLPFQVKRKVKRIDQVFDLLKLAGRPVNVFQTRAAFFRTHKKTLSQSQMSNLLGELVARGDAKRAGTGLFEVKTK